MTTTPVLSQSHFRWRTDAGTIDATPTWGAAEDTNWTQPADTNFRVRFVVQETAGGNPAAATVKLQASHQGGVYFDVTTVSTIVKAVDASSSAEDAATTTRRLSGTGTYVAGRYSEDGSPASTVNLAASQNTEWEFGVQIIDADTAVGDTIDLKVVALSGTAITATLIPRATVSAVTQDLAPSLHTEADVFPAPTVTTTYNLAPSLHTEADTFYSPTVAQPGGTQNLAPSLHVEADTFPGPTVSATYALSPSLHTEADVFPAPTVTTTYNLAPSTHAEVDTFYSPTVELAGGTQNLSPSLFVESDVFHPPTISAVVASFWRRQYASLSLWLGSS